jgi:L-threonylcarbamoyladenylate synthase
MSVESLEHEPQLIEQAAKVIRGGGVVLYPTDTIYGLGCDPFNQTAVRRILKIKKRPVEKGMLVLIPGLEWLEKLSVQTDSGVLQICERFWPGPLTVLLAATPKLSPELTGSEGKIGIRWPANLFLQAWMEKIPGPLVSTSANLSGRKMVESAAELSKQFGSQIELFIQSRETMEGTASTVLDLTTRPPEIVRRGTLSQELCDYLKTG